MTEPISNKFISLHYNGDNLIDYVTDPLNRQVKFEYNSNHNLTKYIDAEGQATLYTYNEKGQMLTITDHQGIQYINNVYDDAGRVIKQDDARNDNQLYSFNYDETRMPGYNITTTIDGNGQTRILTHDANYQLLSIKDELGNIMVQYTYDEYGNRVSETDAYGNISHFTFDESGNMLSSVDAKGNTTSMSYDNRYNLLSVTNATYKTISYQYDDNNNLVYTKDPQGNEVNYTYDAEGFLTQVITPRQGITVYEYANGQVHSVINAVGNMATYGYDSIGRLITTTDGAGKETVFTYDNVDNLISIKDPIGNVLSYEYDSNGDKVKEIDPKGNVTAYKYDGNRNLITQIDPMNNQTKFEYDGTDRLVKVMDPQGNNIIYSYDAKGRLVGTTDPLGNTVSIEYDAMDRVVGTRDALGNKIVSTAYDVLGNPVSVTDAIYRTVYNEYDSLNHLTKVTDPMGRNTSFEYDDLGRMVKSVDPLEGVSKQSFDADGNRTSLIDPNDNVTSFEYDLIGRMISKNIMAGHSGSYNYDSRNLLQKMVNGRNQISEYNYDDAGKLISFTDPTGNVSYSYDSNGNILTVSDDRGIATREYDEFNRVTKYTDVNGNTIQYGYDSVGNMAELTYPDGKQVLYGYDKASQLTTVTDWAGRVTRYEYDANGRMIKTIRANGTVLIMEYDAAGQLIHQKDVDRNGEIISEYSFTYADDGNVVSEDSTIHEQPYSLNEAVMTYTYDNRLATYNGQDITYDADGNMITGPLAGKMDEFEFDSRNRLTRAGNTTYEYDAENNRIAVSDGVYQSSFVINPHAALSQVLTQKDQDGNETFYIYGLGLIGQEVGGEYKTYHYDRRGSTVAITDENGMVTDRFQYSAFGELVSRTGTTNTPFLYNGQDGVISDNNGLYYMRARYYSPEVRRFINQDVILGDIKEGQTLNRYAYVNGNPISYVDPFGLNRCEEFWNSIKNGAAIVWEIVGPDEMTIAWYQAGGPYGLGTGTAGYVISKGGKTVQLIYKGGKWVVKKVGGKGIGKTVWTRTNRIGEFEKWIDNGLKVGNKNFEVNEHLLNSLKKSQRKDIMPDQIINALKQNAKSADRFSWVYTDPKTGVKVYVNEFNDIVGVQPGKFK